MEEDDFSKYLNLVNNCDPDDPLLSNTSLGERLSLIPINNVIDSELVHMTQALNLEQLIPTDKGLARDYRGLAELIGFNVVEIESRFRRSCNPTKSLIDAFKKNYPKLTLNDLIKFIERIERFDVIDDAIPKLVEMASNGRGLRHWSPNKNRNQDMTTDDDSQDLCNFKRLTVDDTNGSNPIYDAFICYAPEDFQYAQDLICLLQDNHKTVATADDLLPGHFEYDAMIKLIDSRCRKVIIVLTPNFSRSRECEFQAKFASEIGIKADCPKIIPVVYEACDDSELPGMIKVLSKIDMTNKFGFTWPEKRLINALGGGRGIENQANIIHHNHLIRRVQKEPVHEIEQTIPPKLQIMIEGDKSSSLNEALCHQVSTTSCNTYDNNTHLEPIVHVMHSECSNSMAISQVSPKSLYPNDLNVTDKKSPPRISYSNSSKPMHWLKNVTRKVLGNEPTHSTTSESMLIPKE